MKKSKRTMTRLRVRPSQVKSRVGFTLVELLVATAATLGLILVCTFMLTAASDGMQKMRGITEIDGRIRNTLTMLRRDLGNVHLGNRKLNKLYTSPDQGPPEVGFFTIEENQPASPTNVAPASTFELRGRQGVDPLNLPIEIDTDDVIGFFVRTPGTKAEDFIQARLYPTGASGALLAAINYLDNTNATSKFDRPGNQAYSTRYGEVYYFLRPAKRQYASGSEVNNPGTTVATPALYTLYRVVRPVLEDDIADALNNDKSLNYTAADVMQRMDVAAVWDPALARVPNPSAAADYGRMRFVKASDLPNRRFRFGLYPTVAPANGTPYATATRFVPLAGIASVDTTSGGVNGGVHNLYQAVAENWFGRPVMREITDTAYIGQVATLNKTSTINASNANNERQYVNEFITPGGIASATAGAADVILTNVVSFDVKVYDDDSDPDLSAWPRNIPGYSADAGATALSRAGNMSATTGMVSSEFVDLGFRGVDETFTWNYNPGGGTPVNWGDHNPARWRTGGMRTANVDDPRNTYDTWWNRADIGWPTSTIAGSATLHHPPYARPLRAIQIKIRVLEPKTAITREFTLVHQFN